MKKNVIIANLIIFLPFILYGQMERNNSFGRIEENLLTQLAIYPQEKIHLHTDRNYYIPGEKIWFKAYLVDALTHQYPTYSRYVYVELISPNDTLVSRVMIRLENGQFYGHIPLTEIVPKGYYTLRAYTRYMENLGDDYFFKKNIQIGSLISPPILSKGDGAIKSDSSSVGANLQFAPQKQKNDFDVSFFPEGGNLVAGVFNKVAIKALKRDGTSESITGEIVDENGVIITTVHILYAGMGVFTFIPNQEKLYFLKCRNDNSLEKQFELPKVDPRAYALSTVQRNKMLIVGVRKSENHPNIPCYLLAHCRGMVFHFTVMNNINEPIAFPEESLPAGVLQFILFDEQMNPLSERLVFSKNYDPAKVDFKTGKASYEKREKVIATLTPSPSGRIGEELFLSVAITDDSDIAVDSTTTILSSLLLSSELKGYIENPAWYLQDNPESATALDYLMMTHGWRRYNIPEVVKGNPEYPTTLYQESQQITGKVQTLALSKPVTDSEIIITMKDGDFGLTSSDENGIFSYADFEYPDSTTYFIQALNSRGSNNVELVLDGESFSQLIHAPQSLTTEMSKLDKKTSNDSTLFSLPVEEDIGGAFAFLEKVEQRAKYDEDIRIIYLNEVEVTAPRIEQKDEARFQFWANKNSDVTIRKEDIVKRSPILVADILREINGVYVSSKGYIQIRQGRGPPLVLIDGIPFNWPTEMKTPYDSPLEIVSVHDVESIDVFKGTSAAMFGVRASGGVISVTTKRGVDENIHKNHALNYTVYIPIGYQKSVEFYSPKYETLEAKHLSIPDFRTTIFWKPDIVISEDIGETTIEFYTSDFRTSYSVVIEGLTTDGRIIRQVEKIRVY